MVLRRLHRRVVAFAAMVCLVLAQSAAAAYACPRNAPEGLANSDAPVPCAHHLAGDTGEAPDPAPAANLCEVHCQTASLPDAGPIDAPAPVLVAAWIVPQVALRAPAAAPVAAVDARSAAPPPLSRYCRLLI